MTFAYFCVFFAIFLPLFCAVYAKKASGFTVADNRNPREFLAKAEGTAARANAAQQNSYEVFPAFAAAVIIAHATGEAAQGVMNFWALVFVCSRIAFIYFYIKDQALLRSVSFAVGLLSIIALFLAAF